MPEDTRITYDEIDFFGKAEAHHAEARLFCAKADFQADILVGQSSFATHEGLPLLEKGMTNREVGMAMLQYYMDRARYSASMAQYCLGVYVQVQTPLTPVFPYSDNLPEDMQPDESAPDRIQLTRYLVKVAGNVITSRVVDPTTGKVYMSEWEISQDFNMEVVDYVDAWDATAQEAMEQDGILENNEETEPDVEQPSEVHEGEADSSE